MINYVELYAELVSSGKIKIDRVPDKYRDAVREEIDNRNGPQFAQWYRTLKND